MVLSVCRPWSLDGKLFGRLSLIASAGKMDDGQPTTNRIHPPNNGLYAYRASRGNAPLNFHPGFLRARLAGISPRPGPSREHNNGTPAARLSPRSVYRKTLIARHAVFNRRQAV